MAGTGCESSPRSVRQRARVHLIQLGQRRHDADDVGRLVPLSAVGHRREKRAVGFGHQSIDRHGADGVAELAPPSET